MPFANLPTHEKDAFFALLDEYFTSRPDLLARVGGAGEGAEMQSSIPAAPAAAAAFTTAQRALANPATSRALTAGIQRAGSAVSASSTGSPPPIVPSRSASSAATDNDPAPSINFGRVAAAAQAFSAVAGPTPPPPRAANPPAHRQAESSSGLVPQKKFGDVDVSSAGAMFRSLRGSTAAKNAPPTPVRTPSAFVPKKVASTFAPPPVRRVSVSPAPEPEPEPEPEEVEEEEVGEWAEALYDYTSEDAGDLHLHAGERVHVTERTSSDWWTGEIGSRSGLFPAAYVRPL
ncbi:SH3-domain-containing protein [Lactarius akahatsu]|uniref:SH3-domain-containing protein n=1 Tax=Lactarius akahatsu TaxID=416441 RepID=A0AAD4LRG1_9AGAM|nr:SH3-domain-containing protein [Lactarius akahatsu]